MLNIMLVDVCCIFLLGDSLVSEFCVLGLWTVCWFHLHRWWEHTIYEDGTDRVCLNVGT